MVVRSTSVRSRVTLLVTGVMLFGAAVSTWLVNLEVRREATEFAEERLRQALGDLTEVFATSARGAEQQAARLGRHGAIAEHAATPTMQTGQAAGAVLDSIAASSAATTSVELWDVRGTRLLGAGDLRDQPPEGLGALRANLAGDTARIGAISVVNDTAVYAIVSAVRVADSVAGYLVQHRRIAGSPEAAQRFRGLIGEGVSILVGNARGDVWTDLTQVVAGPPVAVDSALGGLTGYERDGDRVLAAARVVAGTPWAVLLEFPEAPVLARARSAAGRVGVMTLVLVSIGLLLSWMIARRLTEPLAELADAAESIARGDLTRRVEASRGDEIGQVSAAFNSMAESVSSAHAELERRVLERTAELEAANQELEAFSYSVSHDLRAPLRSIDGFSQALLEDASPRLVDGDKDHLNRVRSATQRMGQLIDDLLQLARVTRGELHREDIDLAALAHDVVAEFGKHESSAVEVAIAPDLRAQGDRQLLRVVLVNLIGNARKFSSGRADARIEVGSEQRNGHRTFYVRDNGVGFDMAYADKLFTPFQRLHRPTEFEGTGIGLATVQRIVRRHGGRVWAKGAVNVGATIWFTLDNVTDLEAGTNA